MDRFTEEQMIDLVAYQNLYGPITPRRMDLLFARLAMDLISPHLKKGKRSTLRDHLMVWSRADRVSRSGREMLGIVQGLQRQFDRDDKSRGRRGRRGRSRTRREV
ncbi:hypothetical protein [Streptomyces sp. STCH 565 A]|uniref:phage tail assembly protein T n=1 Tax=Streptomyces sp. STCH 565 A TaxID=2950532 RepID=UPI0020757FA6|nr:hypothetical protein [Streptomyces sp. STCH 565 A]MCM8550073.1 hypothetical protein [Streptomyces sp. STCH 565 A]